jgi:hypothetical protein
VNDARPRKGLFAAAVAVVILVGAAVWFPRWLENRTYREVEQIAGVGAAVQAGTLGDARKKVDPGVTTEAMRERLGNPSMSVATEGTERREIWTYYYADGTMLVNVTDGVVQRVSATFGTPKIPTSARPE